MLKFDENQLLVFNDRFKYVCEDDGIEEKTPHDTFNRVATLLSSKENNKDLWYSKFMNVMEEGLFCPAGRILANAGTRNNNCFNCFVLPIEDNLISIFDSIKEMAIIQSRGGGTGWNFSTLRPKGDPVKGTNNVTTGVCSFISAHNDCSNIIESGSRRAANMALLDISHPEVEDFIKFKKLNPGKWERFNVSVVVNQAFFECVDRDGDWELKFGGKVYRSVKAKELWRLVCEYAWMYGDPGIIDLEYANTDFNYPLISGSPVIACNPCFSGSTTLLTDKGWISMAELAEKKKPVYIYDGKFGFAKGEVWETDFKRVITLTCSNGKDVTCTPEHQFQTDKGWIQAKDMMPASGFDLPIMTDLDGKQFHVVSISKESDWEEDVYDFSVPTTNMGYVNDCFPVHNCSEKIMHAYDQCDLGSVNLFAHVKNPESVDAYFDWDLFGETIDTAVRLLDNVYDVSDFPLPQNKAFGLAHRRIGVGVMGYADALMSMGIKYSESKDFCQKMMDFMSNRAFMASTKLAKEKMPNGINSELYVQSPFIKRVLKPEIVEHIKTHGIRNMNVVSMAPTGSISMMFGVSSGIEPIFQKSYNRKDGLTGEARLYHHPVYQMCLKKDNFKELDNRGVFETALDLTPEQHLEIHGAFAPYVDSNISKTVNLPEHATIEDVDKAFRLARNYSIKSTTVFRNKSRNGVLTEVAPELCDKCGSVLQTDSNCTFCPSCGKSKCSI